ncbi:MAG: site-2 protease family protein [Candidatus Binatia bacterium]
MLETVADIAFWSIPILLAVVFHEVAHGWVAYRLGDPTAALRGRLTLNPLKHVDPIGTIVVPLLLVLTKAGFIFGWARPVPVNYANLRNPRRDMMLVAAAGPATNLVMAAIAAVVVQAIMMTAPDGKLTEANPIPFGIALIGYYTVTTNVFLALFNMLPIPPLDGGRVMTGLLPPSLAQGFARIEPFGFILLLVLMSTDSLGWIVEAPARAILGLLLG